MYDLLSGRVIKLPKLLRTIYHTLAADGTGMVQYDEEKRQVRRTDLSTGNTVWQRKWECDASVPVTVFDVSDRWLIGVGVKRVHLFDTSTGNDGPRLEDAAPKDAPPDTHFIPVGLSTDGKRVAAMHTANVPERVVVWDLTTGKVVGRLTRPSEDAFPALSADGQHLLTTELGARLVGYDVRTGKVTRHLAATDVADFQLSPDGKVLACFRSPQFRGFGGIGANNEPGGIVRLLNPATGELLPQSPDPVVEMTAVRFADPHTLVTEIETGDGKTAHLVWDTRTNYRRRLSSPFPPVQFAGLGGTFSHELSPDATRYIALVQSKRLAELGGSEVCVTDGTTGRRLYALGGNIHGYPDVPFWVGRGRVGVLSEQALSVFDLTDLKWRTVPLTFRPDWRTHCRPTPDGGTVAMTHPDKDEARPIQHVTWLDVKTGSVTTHHGAVGELTISASGDRVALTDMPDGGNGNYDTLHVTVIDRSGWRRKFRERSSSPPTNFRPAELSPCGRSVFLAHEKPGEREDGAASPVVQFWEALSGELRAEFVTALVADGLGVSPCGRRVATTHRDAPVYLWDVFGEESDPQAKPDSTVWDALDGTTDKAFTAIRRMVQHPTAAVELLSAKLTPAEAPKAEWVKARLDNLGSTDFRTRHTAELELSAVADRIVEPLRKAVAAGADSPEADERLTRLLEKAEGIPRSAWRAVRGVEVLEYCDVPEAAVLLKKLAGGVDTAVLTKEAKAAVKRRGERPA